MTLSGFQQCAGCGKTKAESAFYRSGPWNAAAGHYELGTICKQCAKEGVTAGSVGPSAVPFQQQRPMVIKKRDDFILDPGVAALWQGLVAKMDLGEAPWNLMFLGPSGCGKTEAAKHLAESINVPFIKVDAPSMTDAESWFGTREVIAEDGTSVTTYQPSEFVQAVESECVVVIDEFNRVRDEIRNILLALTDGTRQATNPLTGKPIQRHQRNVIIFTGNVGLQFTGTYAVDPALLTRSAIWRFDYLGRADEIKVVRSRTGVDHQTASYLCRFAEETRRLAKTDEDMIPVSTREVLAVADMIRFGVPSAVAIESCVLAGTSTDGGAESVQHRLRTILAGITPVAAESDEDEPTAESSDPAVYPDA